jgi:hypothetical protein
LMGHQRRQAMKEPGLRGLVDTSEWGSVCVEINALGYTKRAAMVACVRTDPAGV